MGKRYIIKYLGIFLYILLFDICLIKSISFLHQATALASNGSYVKCKNGTKFSVSEAEKYLTLGKLSDQVYGNASDTLDGLKKIDDTFSDTLIDPHIREIMKDNGFHAVTYIDEKTGEITTVFEGTSLSRGLKDISGIADLLLDIGTDVLQVVDKDIPAQYLLAYLYAKEMIKVYPNSNLVLTGHSLGGGLAQYASGMLASRDDIATEAVVFNSAGLFEATITDIWDQNGDQRIAAERIMKNTSVTHIHREGDAISGKGDWIKGFSPVSPQALPFGKKQDCLLPGESQIWSSEHPIAGINGILEKRINDAKRRYENGNTASLLDKNNNAGTLLKPIRRLSVEKLPEPGKLLRVKPLPKIEKLEPIKPLTKPEKLQPIKPLPKPQPIPW